MELPVSCGFTWPCWSNSGRSPLNRNSSVFSLGLLQGNSSKLSLQSLGVESIPGGRVNPRSAFSTALCNLPHPPPRSRFVYFTSIRIFSFCREGAAAAAAAAEGQSQ